MSTDSDAKAVYRKLHPLVEAHAPYPEHLSDARHHALDRALTATLHTAQSAEAHAADFGHIHPEMHTVASAARKVADHAHRALDDHRAAREAHRLQTRKA